MSRTKRQEIEFITHFVDAITVRPFFESLRRIQRSSAQHAMPPVATVARVTTKAA